MKAKTLTKIMSSVLCAALTMQIGWRVKVGNVNAYFGIVTNTDSAGGTIVSIDSSDNTYVGFDFLTENDGSIAITYQINDDGDTFTKHFDNIAILNIEGPACQIDIRSDIEIGMIILREGALIDVHDNCTLSCSEIVNRGSSQIIVEKGATLGCDQVVYGEGSTRLIFTNSGSIICDSIDVADSVDFTRLEYYIAADATIKVTSSLFIGHVTDSSEGYFIAKPTTTISSNGYSSYRDENYSFNLQVGNSKKAITGAFTNKTATSLLDDPGLSFNIPTTVYYGTEYDFESYISVADGYDSSKVYLEYKSSEGILDEKPTAVGENYSVRAVAPDYGTYARVDSGWKNYSIAYLPESMLGVSAPYFTVSGIVNDKYVTGDLLLTTVNGIQAGSSYAPDSDFSNSLTIDSSLMFRDGSLNDDYCIALRRTSDKATTNEHTLSYYYPAASELIYDPYDPYISVQFVDGREMSIEDGTLTGDTVTIGIGDENLDKIYINGELYDYEEIEEGYVELELNSTVGKATDYSIKATDLAGRSSTLEFTLFPNTADADISVSVPGTIYAGDNYSVDVKTNSDGEVTLQYKDASTNTTLSSKPTTAGKYTVTATAEETDFFFEAQDSTTYTIIKRAPDTTVTVPDIITIDSDYTIGVDTDSDGDVTYQYFNKNNTTYPINKPTTAGEYTVTVRTTETSKYYASAASADFTISKRSPSVSLGVGTPYVGTTYKPTFYSNSDAADKAVFEYKEKNADDTKYSTTIPTAYGEYVVRVTIPETAEFVKTTFTADYKIIYLDAPQTAYVVEGQAGKNNYFVSDVELKAPTGYTISAVYGGPYTASIPYKDGITSVYLKRTSDGALTNGVPITNAPMVDKSAPSISAKTGTITPGSVMYVSDFTLNVSDPNLRSLKVNGETIDLSNYKNGYSMTLNPGYGSETYKIMAEDAAGNVTTIEFTLKAEWLKDKVIIPDVVLPLEGNESYNLGDGYWLVTRNTPEGPVTDKTVYSGNMPFYVKEGGDYTFTKVT